MSNEKNDTPIKYTVDFEDGFRLIALWMRQSLVIMNDKPAN